MKDKRVLRILSVLLLLGGLGVACQSGSDETTPAVRTTPIGELLRAGKAPIEVGKLIRGMSPVAPTFTVTLANISDRPVSLVKGTVVFFDANGKCLPNSITESGYTDLTPIAPGDSIQLSIMTDVEEAVSGKWVIKEVIYNKKNPLGKEFPDLPYRWTNPNFDSELAAESSR